MINYLSSTWQRFFMDILMLLSFPCCTVFLSFFFFPGLVLPVCPSGCTVYKIGFLCF